MKRAIGRILVKLGLKKKALRVYFFFINSWTHVVMASRKKALPILVSRRSKNGVYAIDLDSDWLGLGARIVKTLGILLYCEEKGLQPLIRFNYLEKGPRDTDYFGELFRYRQEETTAFTKARFTVIRDVDELGWPEGYNNRLRLNTAKDLFDKYLAIQPDILEEVERFVQVHFKNRKVLGLHYRGTDKAGEAPLVATGQLMENIKAVVLDNPTLELIFISTDDEKIISFLQQSDIQLPVLFREDALRSKDGSQFHRKKEISKSIVHRDAIVNMLLLSRTDFLLKTASILSDCSIIFNPSIGVKVISFPHSEQLTWWPATEIRQRQENSNYATLKNK